MIQAVLFDLDDTLLGNNMEIFIPTYFTVLADYAGELFANKQRFLQELLIGTRAMIENIDRSKTNREVFWSVFSQRTGLDQVTLEPFFDRFYREQFGQLQRVTERRAVAAELVRWCFDQGLQVAIATNPVFPRAAIEQRLAWAGVPVWEFDYALVTSYEGMHATKPHLAYYREVLSTIGCQPQNVLMAGDSWVNDIVPAAQLGMYTFWLPQADDEPSATLATAYGSLDDLYYQLSSGRLFS